MATPQLHSPISLTPVKITSIQPGGGLCMSLEAAWGRIRRVWLRHVRPRYVLRMAELRRGHCEGCCHDIVDGRDLKLYRNVCGYHFGADADPFRGPNRLRLAWAGRAELLFFGLILLAAMAVVTAAATWCHALWLIPLALATVLLVFVVSFFRDPERRIPSDPQALVSPADGTVTHVDKLDQPDFPGGRAV